MGPLEFPETSLLGEGSDDDPDLAAGGQLLVVSPVCDIAPYGTYYVIEHKVGAGSYVELWRWRYLDGGNEVSTDGGSNWTAAGAEPWAFWHRSDDPNSPLIANATNDYRWTVVRPGCPDTPVETASHATCVVPGTPTLTATKNGSTQIDLSWTDATVGTGDLGYTPGTSYADYYAIFYSDDGGSTWTYLDSTGSTSYSDTGLSPSTTRHYKVRGINSNGVDYWCWAGEFSNTDSATTDP
jgi:hypothetical protein